MKKIFTLICLGLLLQASAFNNRPKQWYYQIIVYHLSSASQVQAVDQYLEKAYLPALHKMGLSKIGVFKPISNDTATDKNIYVLIPLKTMDQLDQIETALYADAEHEINGTAYLNTAHNQPAFQRKESMLVKAFENMPGFAIPKLNGTVAEKVYEFRSYEGATEKLYRSKVDMFNAGGEIALFDRLQFNAVFYGSVLSGAKMPNLVYMTSFNNLAERNAKWKIFSDDPEWKSLSSMPKYLNTVSHADIVLMHAAAYSDF